MQGHQQQPGGHNHDNSCYSSTDITSISTRRKQAVNNSSTSPSIEGDLVSATSTLFTSRTRVRPATSQSLRCYYSKEEYDFIEDLKKRNEALHLEQKRLQGKLKMASIAVQRHKDQVDKWKRRCNASMTNQSCGYYVTNGSTSSRGKLKAGIRTASTVKQYGCKTRVAPSFFNMNLSASTSSNAGLQEHQQQQQKKDNNEISISCHATDSDNKIMTADHQQAEEINYSKKKNDVFHSDFSNAKCSSLRNIGNAEVSDDHNVPILLQQLREVKAEMNTLQAQYIALESASEVQLQLHQQTLEQLEECNKYIEELKDDICRLNKSNETWKKTSISLDEHKEIIQELMHENKYLEDKLSTLCELPFLSTDDGTSTISQHHHHHEESEGRNQDCHIEHIQELENQIDQYKQQIVLLTRGDTNFFAHNDNTHDNLFGGDGSNDHQFFSCRLVEDKRSKSDDVEECKTMAISNITEDYNSCCTIYSKKQD